MNQGRKARRVFETVYTDVVGPFPVASNEGYRYYIGFTDKCSSHTWAYFMKHKSEAPDKVIQFLNESIVQGYHVNGMSVVYLSSDRGGEFFNERLSSFLREKGIQHQSAPGYTPEYNAIQERMNRTVVEMAVIFALPVKSSFGVLALRS
jgi:transposase InsO family protein